MGVLKGIADIGTNDAGMTTTGLSTYLAAGLATFLFWLDNWTIDKVRFLREKYIPAPLVGGLYFATVNAALTASGVLTISFNDTLQSFFMLVFFCTVGFTVSIPTLKSGDKNIIIMLLLVTVITFLRSSLDGGLMAAFGQDLRLGVVVGPTALTGDPGTAATFGAIMNAPSDQGDYNMGGTGTIVGVIVAIFGLIMGPIIGDPTAYRGTEQFSLKSTEAALGGDEDGETFTIASGAFTHAAMLPVAAIGIDQLVPVGLKAATDITLPGYVGAVLVAAHMRNTNDVRGKKFPDEKIDAVGGPSLNLLPTMAMVNLKLWQLVDLVLPPIVALLAQIVLMYLFSYYVVFNVADKNHNTIVQTAGLTNFAIGATPNAVASMRAITEQYGPTGETYLVTPMVNGLFIDFANTAITIGLLNRWAP